MTKDEFTERLKEIRKSIKAGVTDHHWIEAEYIATIEDYAKTPTDAQIDLIGEGFDYLAENIEREQAMIAAQNRTRDEWEALEYQYIDRTPVSHVRQTREDVHDELMNELEAARDCYRQMPDDSRREALLLEIARMCDEFPKKIATWKECAYVFCGGVFLANHGHQRYCCEEHKEAQKNAVRRFTKTGTYLPTHTYVPKRGASVEDAYKEHESAQSNRLQNLFYGIHAEDAERGQIAQIYGVKVS